MKKSLFCLLGLAALSSTANAMTLADLESEGYSEVERFNVAGKTVKLYAAYGGTACPANYVLIEGKKVSKDFGTCSDLIKGKVSGNKLILTLPGYLGPFESESAQRKAGKQIYQYTYQNGKVTEKRIK